jgi:Flp pilus assembly pilin Flp
MSMMMSYLRNERGAEMVEWVVVVAVLATVALAVFAGPLQGALESGISNIANIVTNAS